MPKKKFKITNAGSSPDSPDLVDCHSGPAGDQDSWTAAGTGAGEPDDESRSASA